MSVSPARFALALAALALLLAPGCRTGTNLGGASPDIALTSASVAPPTTGVRFTDVTDAAGIHYRWSVAGKRPLNVLQTIGNGCAFLDYDNDGSLDVLLVGPKLALLEGDGHGHFTDVTHRMGLDKFHGDFLGCAVGDYDNDGFDDVYLSGYRTGLLLHNERGKGFRDVTKQAGLALQPWGTSCAWAEMDGSGRLSLFVGNYARFGPHTQPQLCDNNGVQTACGPRFYPPIHGVLYRNLGAGRFQDVTQASGAQRTSGKVLGAAWADFDGSGRPGLALANDEVAGNLLQNRGGRFTDIGPPSGTAYDADGAAHGGMGADWGDYDNDGRPDLAVATFQHERKCLYHNDGHGLFSETSAPLGLGDPAAPYVAFGVKWLDCDNDGWLDLMLANGHVQDNISRIDKTASYRQPILLFRNRQGRAFDDISAPAGLSALPPIVGRGLAVGDFDDDGRVDALVVDSEGAPRLLHNETAHAGHWLSVRLVGVQSNRDGYGAALTATVAGRRLLRVCHSDGSYLSSSDRRVHFGLGAATRVQTLSIRWPSGHTDTLPNVPADHVITLREGSGLQIERKGGRPDRAGVP